MCILAKPKEKRNRDGGEDEEQDSDNRKKRFRCASNTTAEQIEQGDLEAASQQSVDTLMNETCCDT